MCKALLEINENSRRSVLKLFSILVVCVCVCVCPCVRACVCDVAILGEFYVKCVWCSPNGNHVHVLTREHSNLYYAGKLFNLKFQW